jgi:hypothetical protein
MKKTLSALLAVLLILGMVSGAAAAFATEEPSLKEIHTPEDLLEAAKNPNGSYILMEDLDMTGIPWKAWDFSGTLDGNGHAILNLTLTEMGDKKPNSCDGNRKLYETAYFGLFGTLVNAEVKNLKLLNVRALVNIDEPCFVGGLAGYAENATITDCTIVGTLELRAFDRMFGVGGVVGYGSGKVKNCTIDVTLITTDTDATTKDEQFLGGVYATGFMDVRDCNVTIDGYTSEHGYVHNGGIVGMYMEYPLGTGKKGYVTGNHVEGKITFFENNDNRRAYCKAYVGEALVNYYILDDNTNNFEKEEWKDFSEELRPEMCAIPEYIESVITGNCDTYGYTQYTCDGCGYSYKDHYTMFAHTVSVWTEKEAPTLEKEGVETGNCDGCGIEQTRTVPMLEPEPTTTAAPETRPQETPKPQEPPKEKNHLPLILSIAVVVICSVALVILLVQESKRKRRRKRKGGKFNR